MASARTMYNKASQSRFTLGDVGSAQNSVYCLRLLVFDPVFSTCLGNGY